MKRPLFLAIALATLTANAAFAAPRVESIALRGAQQLIASDGSDRTLERLRKTRRRASRKNAGSPKAAASRPSIACTAT